MEQRSNYAAVKDAHIRLSLEGCVFGMGREGSNAAVMDVQMVLLKEECAEDMGRIAHKTDLQHLDHNLK